MPLLDLVQLALPAAAAGLASLLDPLLGAVSPALQPGAADVVGERHALVGLLDPTERTFLANFFQDYAYLAPFTVLLLCGIGLPLPEEVTLIGSGLLLHQGRVEFLPITLVCSAAILIGDSIPYGLGRRYGTKVLRIPGIARILHPERWELLKGRFEEHGNWAIFSCRFLPGLRIPGYFSAGTLGMGYLRFLALDLLGVVISVPISIHLGKIFGDSVERLREQFANLHLLLAFLVVSIGLIWFVRARHSRREKQVRGLSSNKDS